MPGSSEQRQRGLKRSAQSCVKITDMFKKKKIDSAPVVQHESGK